MRENLKLLLFIWWYSLILSQRHWHVITDWQTEPYETKELLTTIKMYITIINILIFIISIGIVIIVIIILTITITFTTINIIIVFVKSACGLSTTISYNSCVTWLLTSNFRTCFFIYLFSLFKSYDILWIKITLDDLTNIDLLWKLIGSKEKKFQLNWSNEQIYSNKYIHLQTSVMASFKYSCGNEVLQDIVFKENRWVTASDFYQYFGRIACFISNKSTNCLGLPETVVHNTCD